MDGTDRLSPAPPARSRGLGSASHLRRLETFVFGERPPEQPGERARLEIREMQRCSEILVCCVQFAAIAFFGLVYALTPKAFPPSTPFEPVPVVLAIYAAVTAIRLLLARRDLLTRPLLVASAVIDVAVLMVTIWSFHLQYDVPAAVYLKAPTLLYVFILIALRTLRLEASLVLSAGAAAAAGWAVLFAYALDEAGPEGITRDWAGYMTSGSILIGAEVDKLLAIAAVTLILAVAVTRARRMMIHAATELRAIEDLSCFFAPGIARTIREADLDMARPGARREAAVLMVDLRGFTALSADLSPEETLALLSSYHSRIVPLIHRHGGDVDKYLGDGILATFGAVRRGGRHAGQGLDALRDVLVHGGAWTREGRREASRRPTSARRWMSERSPSGSWARTEGSSSPSSATW